MRKFVTFKIVILAAFCVLSFAETSYAQKRRAPARRTATRTTAPRPTAATATANAATVKGGAQRISNQIKNLSQFLYLLGGSNQLIKAVDEDARQGKLSQSAQQQSEAGKKGLILTITTFKNAMLKLEEDFRANPALKTYLYQLAGVSELATTAEEQAAANQFDRAGRTLLEALGQLTDTLQAMP